MRFSELINAVEFDGDLLIRVWNEQTEVYEWDCVDYDDLNEQEREELYYLEVTHIYPYSVLPYVAVVVELRAE